jgi:DNA-binding MarR family transcriptional regulator
VTISPGANQVGALVVALGDRMEGAITASSGLARNDAIALSALLHFLEGPRIDRLADVLGLTSSGTVRLVDRLEAAGYVRRSAGEDSRATTVALTATGRRKARAVSDARAAALDRALSVLDPHDRRAFTELAGRVTAGLVAPEREHPWICRLCDTSGCGRPRGECPVAIAAQEVFGPAEG